MSSFHIGELHAKPEERENLLASFKMLHTQPGFIAHTVFVSDTDENHLSTIEEWESAGDHAKFVSSLPEGSFDQWVSMLSESPKGSFFTKISE